MTDFRSSFFVCRIYVNRKFECMDFEDIKYSEIYIDFLYRKVNNKSIYGKTWFERVGSLSELESTSFNIHDLQVAWSPTDEMINNANVTDFMNKHHISSYDELLEKSIKQPEWFYPAILKEMDIQWIKEYNQVLNLAQGKEMPLWFEGGLTNLYINAVEKHVINGRGDSLALIWEGEDGQHKKVTYQQLKEETDVFANGLRHLGVKRGDRVGIFLPPCPELQPVLYACAKIGAIIVPCFSGFGANAISERLSIAEARWLITADGFRRRGKNVDMLSVARQAAQESKSIEKIIIVNHLNQSISLHKNEVYYHDCFIEQEESPVEPMLSTDPYMIIFTSGTTGKPKGTVHTHTGFPIKNAIDMYFCFDVKKDDRVFWLTDIGWMMGPWLLFGTSILGATVVLYEGPPDYPTENRLWELVEKHQITIFGVAPTVIRSLMKFDRFPVKEFDLSSLRILGSTGEAWNPKPWEWYFQRVGGGKCPIINYSGGTEISGGILGCIPIHPQKPCSFNGPLPGMSAVVVDEYGKEQKEAIGDLVIKEPFLGMTQSFWKDHERYLDSYWRKWEGLWHHGDFAQVDKDGFWFILGRSDDTMNVAGKRIGPSELESAVVSHPKVKESAVIGVPDAVKGEVPIMFVVLHNDDEKNDELASELLRTVAEKMGKSLSPKALYFVKNLPKTQSGKVARRLIKAAYLGKPLGDVSTLQNRESLEEIKNIHLA